jgi:hypothetical protein
MCEETQEWMAFIATGHHIRVQREVWSNMHRLNINAFSKPTPQSSVVLEKLTIPHPVKKFPALYAIQRFITMFTRACHLRDAMYPVHTNLFLLRYIYSYPQPTPVSSRWSLFYRFPHKNCVCISFLHHTCDMMPPLTLFYLIMLIKSGDCSAANPNDCIV